MSDLEQTAAVSGRPKRSVVWEYFIYNSKTDKKLSVKSKYLLSGDNSKKKCGDTVAGKFPTNLK